MDIGIDDNSKEKIIKLLEKVLADQNVLYQKLRNFHWNVVGKDFIELHKFFEGAYDSLSEDIDVIAERIRSLDANAIATFTEYLKLASIKETPGKYPDSESMVKELLSDNETVIRNMRSAADECGKLGDAGNEDILIGLMEKHEKTAWMLRSLTQ